MKEIMLKTPDHYTLCVHDFPVENPIAVVQIIHGMEEHQERYEPFVRFLNEHRFSVVTSDMRGHGKNASDLGYFHEKKGHALLVTDQLLIRTYLAKKYPDIPVFLFAHSMGTIITRVLLKKYSSKYQKVILCGYPHYQRLSYFGLLSSTLIKKVRGPKYKSDFLQKNSVGVFNKAIKNPTSDVDWVCSNAETITSYLNDPLCGIGFTCSAFHDLYTLMLQMHQVKNCHNINHSLPFFCISGADDPCTGGTKGTARSLETLRRQGFQNIMKKVYPAMRHELLNETKRDIVYNDILHFYES